MSDKYNDDKIKDIMQSAEIPSELEPENIKTMLDKFAVQKQCRTAIKRKVTKIIPIAAALALITGIGSKLYMDTHTFHDCKNESQLELYATGYGEVYNYFKLSELKSGKSLKDMIFGGETSKNNGISTYGETDKGLIMTEEIDSLADVSDAVGADHYSDTFNQEDGVLEADIVKTDGKMIYYAADNKINYASVDNGQFLSNSQIVLSDSDYIEDIYLYNGRLVVISAYSSQTEDNDAQDAQIDCFRIYGSDTKISIYDPQNNMNLIGNYIQEGTYNDVRLTSDGYLYLISDDEKYLSDRTVSEDDIDLYVPKYSVNDKENYVSAECIVVPEQPVDECADYVSYTNTAGFDLNSQTPYSPVDVKSVAGSASYVYCSSDNIYITENSYDENYNQSTKITRFAIDNGTVSPMAEGKIEGYVNDQFSMSEYNGFFRIAATHEKYVVMGDAEYDITEYQQSNIKNYIYVMDMDMNVVGSVSDFGNGETIKSVNFNGDKAYVVTYMQTDPLYAFDLSDPKNPVALDEFKITGYSTYMQKWSDGLLLGFGISADENGSEQGLKLTMFDNSDPENLKAVSSFEMIDKDDSFYYSEACWERKALLIDSERNIIGFPVTEYNYSNEGSDEEYSYAFYSFENGQFVSKGQIKSFSAELRRAVIIDDYVYAVSDKEFKSADIASFTSEQEVNFN